jgi:hypothetical protein
MVGWWGESVYSVGQLAQTYPAAGEEGTSLTGTGWVYGLAPADFQEEDPVTYFIRSGPTLLTPTYLV